MENFATGLSSGLNLGLRFSSLLDEEEKNKVQIDAAKESLRQSKELFPLKKEAAELDVESKQQSVDINNITLAYKEDILSAELASKRFYNEYTQENTARVREQTKGLISENESKNLTPDTTVITGVIEELQKPNLTQYEINTQAMLLDNLESKKAKAFIKNLDPQYLKAQQSIIPVLTSGDFENLPTGFNDGLTKVLKPMLDSGYLGAKFLTEDGKEGVVKNINLNGDYIAKGRGDQMIMGANVTVMVNGEERVVQTFLPDAAADGSVVFKEGLEADDGKAVSVADVVDYTSSNLPLAQLMYSNPQVLQRLQTINKVSLQPLYGIESNAEIVEGATLRAIFNQGNIQFNTLAQAANIPNLVNASLEDEEMQNALKLFYDVYGEKSGIKLGEDNLYKPVKEGESPIGAIYNSAPNPDKIFGLANGKPFSSANEDYAQTPRAGTPPVVDIFGNAFAFNSSREEINQTLINAFKGNAMLTNEIEYFNSAFESALNKGDAREDDYLMSLKSHINKTILSLKSGS
jgi:hypothetical protein